MFSKKLSLLFLAGLFVNVLSILPDIEETKTIKTPWFVLISKLQDNNENGMNLEKKTCPGALIHPQVVLATATCLHINLEETKNLIVEAYNQSRQVSQVNFREYNTQYFLHNNYAVLKLSDPFFLNSNLNTIILASVNEYLDVRKCKQLTYYGKSSENATLSKVLGNIKFSKFSHCNQNMYQMYLTYKKSNIFWHPSILCSTRLNIIDCIDLKDWSSIVTCARYPESNMPVLTGFQINFLAEKDDCIFVYSNMFQASSWIKEQIESFFKN